MKVSPDYLLTTPGNATNATYASTSDLTVTPLLGSNSSASSFFVVRHADYSSRESVNYTLNLPTSAGKLSIPQLGGSLTLSGRDSKIHVVDYDVAGTNILYSTGEIFTWKESDGESLLVLYGGSGEYHEIAVSGASKSSVVGGSSDGVSSKQVNSTLVIGWNVSSDRRIIQVDDMKIVLLGMLYGFLLIFSSE